MGHTQHSKLLCWWLIETCFWPHDWFYDTLMTSLCCSSARSASRDEFSLFLGLSHHYLRRWASGQRPGTAVWWLRWLHSPAEYLIKAVWFPTLILLEVTEEKSLNDPDFTDLLHICSDCVCTQTLLLLRMAYRHVNQVFHWGVWSALTANILSSAAPSWILYFCWFPVRVLQVRRAAASSLSSEQQNSFRSRPNGFFIDHAREWREATLPVCWRSLTC